jgi:hypothetical protein
MDDIIENDPSRGGEASLWNPSVSSEESTRHSNMSSTILNSGSQTLSQSLLSPRIRIEEARQFNDELVGQDPGAQCDSLRDLGQIVDETLDSLAKQVCHLSSIYYIYGQYILCSMCQCTLSILCRRLPRMITSFGTSTMRSRTCTGGESCAGTSWRSS